MRPLVQQISLYSLFAALNAIIGFVSVPILTRFLAPEAYGALSMFELLLSLLVPFITLETQVALRREYVREEHTNRAGYLISSFALPCLTALILTPILILTSRWLGELFSLSTELLLLALAIAWLRGYFTLLSSLLQIRKQVFWHGLLKVGSRFFTLLAMLVFIGAMGLGWQGQAYAHLIAAALAAIIAIGYLRKLSGLQLTQIKADHIKSNVRYGAALIPYTLGHFLLMGTDRLLLSNFVSLEQTGIYTGAFKIASVLLLLFEGIRLAWEPWLFPKLKRYAAHDQRNIRHFYLGFFALSIAIASGIALTAHWLVPLILTPRYASATVYLPWLLTALTFYMAYVMLNTLLLYEKAGKTQSVITITLAGINVVISYAALQYFGAVGVAMATATTYAVAWLMMLALTYRRYPELYRLRG